MEMYDCGDRVNFRRKSRLLQRKCSLKWTLDGFPKYQNAKTMQGSPFYLLQDKIGFRVSYSREGKKLYSTLYRHTGAVGILIKYSVTITDGKDKIWYNHSDVFDISTHLCNTIVNGVICCREEKNDTEEETVEIILVLEMDEIKTEEFYNLPTPEEFRLDVHKSFSQDIANLFENQMATDVTLRVEEDSVGAHKTILSARSPVFAKMFHKDTDESHSNVVEIKDVEMPILKQLLAFMYSKASYNYDFSTALALYYAADKYEVLKLREVCAFVLVSYLDRGNAGCVLKLADRHEDKNLKKRTMNFIDFNLKSCIKSEWWKEIMREQNDLTSELETFIADAH